MQLGVLTMLNDMSLVLGMFKVLKYFVLSDEVLNGVLKCWVLSLLLCGLLLLYCVRAY
jgi:hypothetical protein